MHFFRPNLLPTNEKKSAQTDQTPSYLEVYFGHVLEVGVSIPGPF